MVTLTGAAKALPATRLKATMLVWMNFMLSPVFE
jgi:hypothetical protein